MRGERAGSDASADRSRERGLFASGGGAAHPLAKSGALPGRLCAADAPRPRGCRPITRFPQTGRWSAQVPSTNVSSPRPSGAVNLRALDDALALLAEKDVRKSRVVELRFFGGLSVEDTAQALHTSMRTVMRDWRLARAWLSREMTKIRRHDPRPLAGGSPSLYDGVLARDADDRQPTCKPRVRVTKLSGARSRRCWLTTRARRWWISLLGCRPRRR